MVKSKRTPEREEKILSLLRSGCYQVVAARAAGISKDTYYQWIKRYPDFADKAKTSLAEAEARLVMIVQESAPKNWQAAMTLLERRWPERWARRDIPVRNHDRPIYYDMGALSLEELKMLELLLKKAGQGAKTGGTQAQAAVDEDLETYTADNAH